MSPLSSIVAASSPLPDRGPILEDLGRTPLRPSDAPRGADRRSSVVTRSQPVRSDRTRGPSMITRRGDLVGFEPSIDPGPPPPLLDRDLDTEPPPPRPPVPAPTPVVITPPPPPRENGSVALRTQAQPALERPAPPPRSRSALDLGLDGPAAIPSMPPTPRRKSSVRGDEIVAHFERQRRRRRAALGLGIFVALGLGGGAAFAMFGPDQNPLRIFAERYGILPPGSRPPTPEQNAALEKARRALDLDSLADLEEADRLLTEALQASGDDLTLRSELGLILSTRADALRRGAARADLRAQKLDQDAGQPTEDARALRQAAAKDRGVASQLVKRAFELIRPAYEKEPDALAPSRALADYYRVQRDESGRMKQVLGQAKTAAQTANTTDAATLYIEAADVVKDVSRALPADLERGTRLLEEALTVRPTLNRARVLLARIMAARGQDELAETELKRVLESAPQHSEAKDLLESVAAKRAAATPAPSPTPEASASPSAEPSASPSVSAAPPSPSPSPSASPSASAAAPPTTPRPTPTPSGTASPVASASPSAAPVKGGYDGYMKQADRLRERGQAWEALLSYEKGADLKPSSGRAYAGMGWCYLDLGKPEAALHQFRKAIAVEPAYAEGHLGHAEATARSATPRRRCRRTSATSRSARVGAETAAGDRRSKWDRPRARRERLRHCPGHPLDPRADQRDLERLAEHGLGPQRCAALLLSAIRDARSPPGSGALSIALSTASPDTSGSIQSSTASSLGS
jgi:tetratricopeptide (TPR) repeat protein